LHAVVDLNLLTKNFLYQMFLTRQHGILLDYSKN